MPLLMTQIMVGGSQCAYLVQETLTGVSSKGKAIPSSAWSWGTWILLWHLRLKVACWLAWQLLSPLLDCEVPPLQQVSHCLVEKASMPGGFASARASTELCPASSAAAEQPSPLASPGQKAEAWSPAPQQVSLFICAPRISKLVLNAMKPSASGHTKEINVITSNTK